MALVETLTGVTDADAYVDELMAKTHLDPIKDYALHHAKPFGHDTDNGKTEILKIEADINADGRPDFLITNSQLKAGEAGYWWEAYLSEGDGYRWQRDSLVFQENVR